MGNNNFSNRIAIIRSACSAVSKSQYNIQEIGLAKELSLLGMIVDVFLISDKDKTYVEKIEGYDGVTIYWLDGIKIPGQQGYYKDLIPILNEHKYDLIQALDDSQITTVLVSNYCKKNKIKFVLWQGMYENYPEKYKRLIQYVFDWTFLKNLRKNTKYCLSKTTSANKYLESKKFPTAKVIPVGLELSNFNSTCTTNYREKFNISENKKILLYVGKVEERRKPIFCLDVYNVVKKKYPDICLVYVGNGPMRDETHEYVKNNNIEDVILVDKIQQSELSSLYKESSMFILPTRYEIFGMVLMEAMYFGTPVITYKAAGPIDVIENNIDGIIMNNFNVTEWAEKIVLALTKMDLIQMGNVAKNKIESNYTWKSLAKDYYDTYMDIIKR